MDEVRKNSEHLCAVEGCTGDVPDFFRETAFRGPQVDPDADHDLAQTAGFQIHAGLGQDTADLSSIINNVIGPFDHGRNACLL